MTNRVQKKITQTRNILIVVIAVCAAKLVKIIMDGDAKTTQIVVLAIVIVVLGVILGLYSLLDRYTKKEQENYGLSSNVSEKLDGTANPLNLKNLLNEILNKNKPQ